MKLTRKVKVKRRKINIVRTLIVFLSLYLIIVVFLKITSVNIKNIYILNNKILSDQTIIEIAKLENYPSFYQTSSLSIKKRLLKNPYLKEVKVRKKLFNKVYIEIVEHNLLFIYNDEIVTEVGTFLTNDYNIKEIPILTNQVPKGIFKELLSVMNLVNEEIKQKISEIKYDPNKIDKGRFFLTMNDGNYVYLTLTKFKEINNYLKIVATLESANGILYLDSGNYFEKLES